MREYRVNSRHKVYGYNTHFMISTQADSGRGESEALKDVKNRSGLGRFDTWEFFIESTKKVSR